MGSACCSRRQMRPRRYGNRVVLGAHPQADPRFTFPIPISQFLHQSEPGARDSTSANQQLAV
jgi:hypothetical protein